MAEEKKQLYREEALQSIASPEQLTDYLKVTNPGIWVLLATIILILCGLMAWGTVGNLETLEYCKAQVKDGAADIIVPDISKGMPEAGMTLRIGEAEYALTFVEDDGTGRINAFAPVNVEDGTYDAEIVIESVHPIYFLLN